MNKIFFTVLLGLLLGPLEDALASASLTWQATYTEMTKSIGDGTDTDSKSTTRPTYDVGDFVIKMYVAALGNDGHGYDKIYSVIAEERYENGVCLRPVQISCYASSGYMDDTSHTRYMAAGDDIAEKCQVFCADGYTGADCSIKLVDATNEADKKEVTPSTGDWMLAPYSFNGYAGDTTYEASIKDAMYLHGYKWYENQEADILLGVTKFLPNGVKVAPITVLCGSRRKGKDDHIFEKIKSGASGEILLCSNGYVPNKDNTDCVSLNSPDAPGVVVQNKYGTFTKYTDEKTIALYESLKAKSGFDENIHQIIDTGTTLAIECKNSAYGFVSPDSLNCVECVKGGSKKSGVARPNTGVGYGVCVECDSGEVYDTTSFTCNKAVGFSKDDMLYGQDGRTKGNLAIEQCWTMISDPDAYKNCLFGQTEPVKILLPSSVAKMPANKLSVTKK